MIEQNHKMSTEVKNKNKEQQFVEFVIKRCNQDKGFAARLRRADNPSTEYQSWEILGPWIELDQAWQRLPYATVAAAIARSKAPKNGSLSLGRAIAFSYAEKSSTKDNDRVPARLRRLLSCNDVKEVCRVIRPILTLISSKIDQPLDYGKLLSELRYFGEKSKIRWVQDFYGYKKQDGQGGNAWIS